MAAKAWALVLLVAAGLVAWTASGLVSDMRVSGPAPVARVDGARVFLTLSGTWGEEIFELPGSAEAARSLAQADPGAKSVLSAKVSVGGSEVGCSSLSIYPVPGGATERALASGGMAGAASVLAAGGGLWSLGPDGACSAALARDSDELFRVAAGQGTGLAGFGILALAACLLSSGGVFLLMGGSAAAMMLVGSLLMAAGGAPGGAEALLGAVATEGLPWVRSLF